jgi:tetratricopeptide (TPR) repeat protein
VPEASVRGVARFVPLLFVIDGALLVAHVVLGGSPTWNLDREHNVPTWFAGAQLIFVALAALQCFDAERSRSPRAFPPTGAWVVAAAFFSYLSLDETTVIHEGFLRHEVRDLLPPDSLWISLLPWQIVFGPFLLIAALLLLALFASRFVRSPRLVRPALAGLGCWAAAMLAEGLAKPLFMAGGFYRTEVAIEEGFELGGATLLLLAFTRYAQMLVVGGVPLVELRLDARRFAAWAFALVAFLTFAAAAVTGMSLQNSAWLYRHNATELAKRDKHADAIAAFQQALARDAEDVESLRGLAREHLRLDEGESALSVLERAIALRPRDARLWNAKGVALHELGRFPEAETAYREAIAASPRYTRAQANLGLAIEKQGRLEEALAQYRRVLAIEPGQRLARERLRRLARDG